LPHAVAIHSDYTVDVQYVTFDSSMKNLRSASFSIIEMLVVTAILALLISLSFPAFRSIREMSRASICVNNLRQIGVGLFAYSSDHNGFFPPGSINEPTGPQSQTNTWPYLAWQYFGYGDPKVTFIRRVHDTRFDLLPGATPNIFVCPKTRVEMIKYPGATDNGKHCYAFNNEPADRVYPTTAAVGSGRFQTNRAWIKTSSETALVVEDMYNVTGCSGYINRTGLIPHRAGMNVVYYDGHVGWIPYYDIPLNQRCNFWEGNRKY